MTGWFSLHRKIKDSPVFSDPYLLKLWLMCLMKASHTEHDQLVGSQVVKLKPGEFVTGRFALADEYNKGAKKDDVVADRTLWRWIKLFEKWQMLTIKSTTKYSVVTVINWSSYQGGDHQVSIKCPTDDHQMSTNNNGNNANKENKKTSRHKQVYDAESPAFKIADFFYKEILRNNPGHKEPNLQNWADEIRKIIELDGRDKSEVSRLIRWVQQDSFEMANVLSPAKLRTRYDALVIKMNQNSKGATIYHMPTAKPQEYKHDINAGES